MGLWVCKQHSDLSFAVPPHCVNTFTKLHISTLTYNLISQQTTLGITMYITNRSVYHKPKEVWLTVLYPRTLGKTWLTALCPKILEEA